MRINRFFHFVWRLNALLILCVGLGAGFWIANELRHLVQNIFSTRYATNIVNIENNKTIKEKFVLGTPSLVPGTHYLSIPISSEQSYQQSYYSKEPSAVRNYMFIDSRDLSTHWLLPKNQFLITMKYGYGEHTNPLYDYPLEKGFIYVLVKEDTDHDARLTSNDSQCVVISDAIGLQQTEILSNIDKYRDFTRIDDQTALLFYIQQGKSYIARVDLNKRTIIKIQEIVSHP